MPPSTDTHAGALPLLAPPSPELPASPAPLVPVPELPPSSTVPLPAPLLPVLPLPPRSGPPLLLPLLELPLPLLPELVPLPLEVPPAGGPDVLLQCESRSVAEAVNGATHAIQAYIRLIESSNRVCANATSRGAIAQIGAGARPRLPRKWSHAFATLASQMLNHLRPKDDADIGFVHSIRTSHQAFEGLEAAPRVDSLGYFAHTEIAGWRRSLMAMAMWGFDRVCVAVLQSNPPTEREWADWIGLLRQRAGGPLRVLVETQSGPNAAQRKALANATRNEDVRFAILTNSILVRGIITALAWLGVPHQGFATGQHREAADWLGLTNAELERVLHELPRLRGEAELRLAGLESSG